MKTDSQNIFRNTGQALSVNTVTQRFYLLKPGLLKDKVLVRYLKGSGSSYFEIFQSLPIRSRLMTTLTWSTCLAGALETAGYC